MKLRCNHCGSIFESATRKKFCSSKCSKAEWNLYQEDIKPARICICSDCGKEFGYEGFQKRCPECKKSHISKLNKEQASKDYALEKIEGKSKEFSMKNYRQLRSSILKKINKFGAKETILKELEELRNFIENSEIPEHLSNQVACIYRLYNLRDFFNEKYKS